MKDNEVAAVTFGISQSVALWLAFCPELKDVRDASADQSGFVTDFRHSEIVAGIATLGVGAVGSIMSRSFLPVAMASLVVFGLAALYEWSLIQPPTVATVTQLHVVPDDGE